MLQLCLPISLYALITVILSAHLPLLLLSAVNTCSEEENHKPDAEFHGKHPIQKFPEIMFVKREHGLEYP